MSSHKIAVLENIRSAQIEQQRIETLSSTKLWVGMAAGVTLTGVTTAAIAFTVPAASVICGAAASVLAVAAAVFALVAAGLYVAKKQALFDCLFYVNGHRIADRGQVSILRQFSPRRANSSLPSDSLTPGIFVGTQSNSAILVKKSCSFS